MAKPHQNKEAQAARLKHATSNIKSIVEKNMHLQYHKKFNKPVIR
jgi:hypothetical protein